MSLKLSLMTLLSLTFFANVVAEEPGKMLRVDLTITEKEGQEPTEVKLNLPLTMIAEMKPQLDQALANVTIPDQQGAKAADLRAIWQQVRNAGPTRFVEIKNTDAKVSVDTTDTHIVISVDSKDAGVINANLPMALGDALFSETTVDTQSLIDALNAHQGDLVTINGDEVKGRVWIE